MAAFHYTAINTQSKTEKGVIEAENVKQARIFLRQRNLIPLDVKSAAENSSKKLFSFSKQKISKKQTMSSKELSLMTRQLATLISAGLPLEEVLAAVAEQTEKPRTKGLILSVRARVLEGHSFAAALKEFPSAFSSLYCATVAAGEKSGHLDIVLQRLADYTEQQYQMRQKILHALIYPSVMVFVAVSIVTFLLEYVVPKMIAVYGNIGQTLPTMTQVLIAISHGVQAYGLYCVLILILLLYGFYWMNKRNALFREKFHAYLLRLPILGNAIKTINTARFARTFAIMFAAGVSIIDAMHISAALITNIPIRKAVEEAAARVREGANIHLALKQTTYFSPMAIHLIASGEASGQLENMLQRAADTQETAITRLIETSLALFEPAIILIMGAIVLFIVLAVLLPIFQLDQFT